MTKLRGVLVPLLVLHGLVAACTEKNQPPTPPPDGGANDAGSDTGGQPDTGNDAGDAGGGGDGGGDGGAGNNTPITARPSRGTYQCRIARDRVDHTPRWWRAAPALVTTSGGATYFMRREVTTQNPIFPAAGQLVVGSLGVDGSFGTPTVVAPASPSEVGPMTGAPSGTGFAVVWVEGSKLRFAAFDASGASQVAPKDITAGLDELANPQLAAGPDGGFGVVYSPLGPSNARQVQFLALDAQGGLKAGPRRLDEAGAAAAFPPAPGATIAGGPSGYAMIWRHPTDPRGGIDFAKADAAGTQLVARRRISVTSDANTVVGGGAGFDTPTNALIETAGGYLAAWNEIRQNFMSYDNGAYATVQLVRLDASGARLGAPVPMRAPTDSIDEVEPSLVRFGAAVGVLWSRGKHIYICAGCKPDHQIDLLLIDPTDLTPLSNVVSVTNAGSTPGGGLLRRQVAVAGKSLLTTFHLTFHVHATAGSATFACDP